MLSSCYVRTLPPHNMCAYGPDTAVFTFTASRVMECFLAHSLNITTCKHPIELAKKTLFEFWLIFDDTNLDLGELVGMIIFNLFKARPHNASFCTPDVVELNERPEFNVWPNTFVQITIDTLFFFFSYYLKGDPQSVLFLDLVSWECIWVLR